MNTWDTFPVHDERIPPGLYLAADCSLDIGAVRSSFWQELRAGLGCWEPSGSVIEAVMANRTVPASVSEEDFGG